MRSLNRIRRRFSPGARVAHAVLGSVLLVLPGVVVWRDGIAGATVGSVLSALFGVGYLVAAVVGGTISSDMLGESA